jgi:hypothetical protein
MVRFPWPVMLIFQSSYRILSVRGVLKFWYEGFFSSPTVTLNLAVGEAANLSRGHRYAFRQQQLAL